MIVTLTALVMSLGTHCSVITVEADAIFNLATINRIESRCSHYYKDKPCLSKVRFIDNHYSATCGASTVGE